MRRWSTPYPPRPWSDMEACVQRSASLIHHGQAENSLCCPSAAKWGMHVRSGVLAARFSRFQASDSKPYVTACVLGPRSRSLRPKSVRVPYERNVRESVGSPTYHLNRPSLSTLTGLLTIPNDVAPTRPRLRYRVVGVGPSLKSYKKYSMSREHYSKGLHDLCDGNGEERLSSREKQFHVAGVSRNVL